MSVARFAILFVGGLACGLAWGRFDSASSGRSSRSSASAAVEAESPAAIRSPAKLDPAERVGRLLSALKDSEVLRGRATLFEELSHLSAEELAALMARAEGLPAKFRDDLEQAALERWLQADQDGANAWMNAHLERSYLWRIWIRHSPEVSAHAFLANNNSPAWYWQIGYALSLMTDKTPAEKVAYVASAPAGGPRNRQLRSVLLEWANTDSAGALDNLSAMAPGKMRDEMRNQLLGKLADTQPDAAKQRAQALLTSDSNAGADAITTVAGALAKVDPKNAADWLAQFPDEVRTKAGAAVARFWAQSDAVAALNWCAEQGIDLGAPWILQEAFANRPGETMDWIEGQAAGPEHDRLVEHALRERLKGLPEDGVAANTELSRLYGDLPPEAQARAARAIGMKAGGDGHFANLDQWIGMKAGVDAHFAHLDQWASQFEGSARSEAISGVMRAVCGHDPDAAQQMLETLSDSKDRDAALQGLVLGRFHPDVIGRALEISDPTMRSDTLEAMIDNWSSWSPGDCRSWIVRNAAQLPPEIVAEWQARLANK
ncbi:MAG TPA: hypothetical protein VGH90_12155 [Chthoniobacteraceae bacterium]